MQFANLPSAKGGRGCSGNVTVLELLLPIDSLSPPCVAGATPSSETSRRIDLKCFDMMLQAS